MEQQQLSVHDDAPAKITKIIQVSGRATPIEPLDAISVTGTDSSNGSELPATADTSPPPEALSAFVQAIEAACYPSTRMPSWWLAAAMKRFDRLCAYCGQNAGSAPDVDAVIPVMAGGPQRPDAAVLACKACRRGRRRRDLLLWKPNASPKLKAMRAALALDS